LHLRNFSVKLKFRGIIGIISQGKALDRNLSFAFIIFYPFITAGIPLSLLINNVIRDLDPMFTIYEKQNYNFVTLHYHEEI
jgi:hypothetical protein